MSHFNNCPCLCEKGFAGVHSVSLIVARMIIALIGATQYSFDELAKVWASTFTEEL